MKKKFIFITLFVTFFTLIKTEELLNWFRKKTPPAKTAPSDIKRARFYPLSDSHRVMVVQGDLFNLSSFITMQLEKNQPYTIVNAANKVLFLGGGIAGEIKKRDESKTIQKECDAIVQQHGIVAKTAYQKRTGFFGHTSYDKTLPVGTAWITTSGTLSTANISSIIHAIGPNCQEKNDLYERENFEAFLHKTYGNIFSATLEHNNTADEKIQVIACPSISTNIFKCDIKKSAAVAAEVILHFMHKCAQNKDPYGPGIFIMVTWSDEDFIAYRNAFDLVYSSVFK